MFFSSDNGPWLIHLENGGSAGLLRDGKTTTWEGGVRVPGMIRWPTKIAPRISEEVATTYDIFPTVMALAGVSLELDREYDGKDLSGLLLKAEPSPHECIFHWKGASDLKCPGNSTTCPGLWAVRCGNYKLHYVTSSWFGPGGSNNGTFHDPPLIYQIERDPGENYPLNPQLAEWQAANDTIEIAAEAHRQSIKQVPNQMAFPPNPSYGVCGTGCKGCVCNASNFNAFVCGNPYPVEQVDAINSYGGYMGSLVDGIGHQPW